VGSDAPGPGHLDRDRCENGSGRRHEGFRGVGEAEPPQWPAVRPGGGQQAGRAGMNGSRRKGTNSAGERRRQGRWSRDREIEGASLEPGPPAGHPYGRPWNGRGTRITR
jgi:hypothetical protein